MKNENLILECLRELLYIMPDKENRRNLIKQIDGVFNPTKSNEPCCQIPEEDAKQLKEGEGK